MSNRNELCWCGSGKKWKKCHFPASNPSPSEKEFIELARTYYKRYGIFLKTPEQIQGIRKACHAVAKILDEVADAVVEGMTTDAINSLAHEKILALGAVPASLHYGEPPFPKSICTSVNEVVCHGIPGRYALRHGDIVNIDIALILDGYFGDCSKMVAIGTVSPDKKHVFDVSLHCLESAIAVVRPGEMVSKIGQVIHQIADAHHCGVVDVFVGHGVGLRYHEAPHVAHCRNNVHIPMVPGMIFTIEPMINFGSPALVVDPIDQWTATTKDGKPSAQWEKQLLVTPTGVEVLTPWQPTTCVTQ